MRVLMGYIREGESLQRERGGSSWPMRLGSTNWGAWKAVQKRVYVKAPAGQAAIEEAVTTVIRHRSLSSSRKTFDL
jgi:hypothetical protein